MSKQTYCGVYDPEAQFEALRPYRKALIHMKTQVRPLGSDYLILDAAMQALDTAAYHFTGDPTFFHLRPHTS